MRILHFKVVLAAIFIKIEPDGEVELASTLRVNALRTAKMQLSHKKY